MTREEARQIIATWLVSSKGVKGQRGYIEGWFDEEDVEAFRMAIEALSEPKTGWIPVSEKPKDEKKVYLVQLDGGGMCSCRWTNANPFWTELTTDWHWNIFDIPQYCKVVAWMDLESYREDSEA